MDELSRAQSERSGATSRLGLPTEGEPGPAFEPECTRTLLLQGVSQGAVGMTEIMRSGHSESPATQRLAEALEPVAQRELSAHLGRLSCGGSDQSFQMRALEAVGGLAERMDGPSVQVLLERSLASAEAGVRGAVLQSTSNDLHVIQQSLLHASSRSGTEASTFAEVVDHVRLNYGHRGPRVLRTATEIAQEVDGLVAYLANGLAAAFQKFGMSEEHGPETIDTLRRACIVMVDHGLTRTTDVNAFLTGARSHDHRIAMVGGALSQLGYVAGMTSFMYGVAPRIADALLGATPGFREAVAFGAVAGFMVGPLDCIAGSGAAAFAEAMSYARPDQINDTSAQAMHMSEGKEIRTRMGIAAATTFAKNALLRVAVPSVIYGLAFPAGINRDVRDGLDLLADAGGGMLSSGFANVLVHRTLNNSSSANYKLLAQRNLPQVVQRSQGTAQPAMASQALVAYARGLATGIVAPSTLAVSGLVIAPLVAVLLGINSGVIPGLGLSSSRDVPDSGLTGDATGLSASSQAPILAAEHALRATVSSLLMTVLAAGSTGVGNVVGRRADANVVSAVFGAVGLAARSLAALGQASLRSDAGSVPLPRARE